MRRIAHTVQTRERLATLSLALKPRCKDLDVHCQRKFLARKPASTYMSFTPACREDRK